MSAVLSPDPIALYFAQKLREAEVKPDPYPSVYITDVLPKRYYQQLLDNLPPDGLYNDRQFENRMMVRCNELGGFWQYCSEWLMSPEVIGTLFDVFNIKVKAAKADVRLVRDSKGYRIAPHTDIARKLLSLLFYLKNEEHPTEGTTILVPKQKGFTSDGSRRYEFEDFEEVFTAPFRPNSMLGFPRSEVSFHGVKGTSLPRRDVLLLNLYA